MKEQKISIIINKPIAIVFAFTIDPKNTSQWIESVVIEETNQWPPKLGTIYRNKGKDGVWRELELTEFEKDKTLVFSDKTGFHIRYTFIALADNITELAFQIWMDEGELKNFFSEKEPERLKKLIETQR